MADASKSSVSVLLLLALAAGAALVVVHQCGAITDEDFVCREQVKRDIASHPTVDLAAPGPKLWSQCGSEVSGSTVRITKKVLAREFDELREELRAPACFAAAYYEASSYCSGQLGARRRTCSLFDDPRVAKVGSNLVEQLDAEPGIAWESRGAKRAAAVVERLREHWDFSCFTEPPRVGELETSSVNAAALPNGVLLFTSGMLDATTDAELAGVAGHELAHLEHNSFSAALILLAGESGSVADGLRDLKDILLSACTGPLDEVEVDALGIRMAEAAGYDPFATVGFLQSLVSHRPDTAYALSDSHPPPAMRASLAADAALQAMNYRKWHADAYYRGSDIDSFRLTPWNGDLPKGDFLAACRVDGSDCGASDAVPDGVAASDWSSYRCMARSDSSDLGSCLARGRYSNVRGRGCPGAELCCRE